LSIYKIAALNAELLNNKWFACTALVTGRMFDKINYTKQQIMDIFIE